MDQKLVLLTCLAVSIYPYEALIVSVVAANASQMALVAQSQTFVVRDGLRLGFLA